MHKYNKNFLLLFSRGEISGYGHYKRSSLFEKYIKKFSDALNRLIKTNGRVLARYACIFN